MEDQVFLEISSMKGVMRFGKKRKLSLRYIGPFEVVSCVGNVAYRMALPARESVVEESFDRRSQM